MGRAVGGKLLDVCAAKRRLGTTMCTANGGGEEWKAVPAVL